MSEFYSTADQAFSQDIPRIHESFGVDENSYVDLRLPDTSNERATLRLFDFNERWVRAVDLSGFYRMPERDDEKFFNAPQATYDHFALDEEFFIGRDHNPDDLPILNKNVVSRKQVSLTLKLGERGLILSIRDTFSHNGTELIPNETLALLEVEPHLIHA